MKADMPNTVPVNSRKRILLRWTRYLLAGLLILLIALVCAGTVYEGIESHRDQQRFHPPGRLKVRFPGNLTEPVNREWAKMQEELAHLSSNSSLLVVKGSGHDIQIDNPDAVAGAIREVARKAKGSD